MSTPTLFTGRTTGQAATPLADATNWREYRACAGEDPDLFTDDNRRTAAKAVCVRCPVRSFCLQLASAGRSCWSCTAGTGPRGGSRRCCTRTCRPSTGC
ncbi:WhiB family transcriptional regulator [Streptomyces platensis]|uniref:WhiB family transcriptional regulator n=1 Tax=Streptomyces platensis TaxID=58346 RepID=UPI00331C6CCC